jgi:hypothetical protein
MDASHLAQGGAYDPQRVMAHRSDRDPPNLNMDQGFRALGGNEARVSGYHQGPQASACNHRPDIRLQPMPPPVSE